MAVTPNAVVTAQSVASAQAHLTAAKTTYTDATNAVLLFTAGPNGAIIYKMTGMAPGTTGGAGRVDVFSSPNGTALHFINAANFASYTQSTTAAPTLIDMGWNETAPRRCVANEQIWVSTSIAATAGFDVDCQYENL